MNRTEDSRVIYGQHFGKPEDEPSYVQTAIKLIETSLPGLQLKVDDNARVDPTTDTAYISFSQFLNGLLIDDTDARVFVVSRQPYPFPLRH